MVLRVKTAVSFMLVSGASRPFHTAGAAHRLCSMVQWLEHTCGKCKWEEVAALQQLFLERLYFQGETRENL